jgi:hypothetical protein
MKKVKTRFTNGPLTMTMRRVGNLTYVEGFPAVSFVPRGELSAPKIDPNHIALVNNKYYLGGIEIPAEHGEALLEKSMKEGGNYTIFQPIPRRN